MRETGGIAIPDGVIEKWQSVVDVLADIMNMPAALIMKVQGEDIEVFLAGKSSGNPYVPGESERLEDSGLYCETVIKTRQKLEVINALKDKDWADNPDIKRNMISYLGFPLVWPDKKIFGTICVLDTGERKHDTKKTGYFVKLKELIEAQLALIKSNAEKEELIVKSREHINKVEQFNKLCVEREFRIIGLKKEINALLKELGRNPRYDV